MSGVVLIRGGGDLASGAALRMYKVGIVPLIVERHKPLMIRRTVSFAEAVYAGKVVVEDVEARFAADWQEALSLQKEGVLVVFIDPHLENLKDVNPLAIIDARMTKQYPESSVHTATLVVGLGPGFVAGENCHAIVETARGHHLGRVIWQGAAEPDTGIPGSIAEMDVDRVLRAPTSGKVIAKTQIGDELIKGDLIAEINGRRLKAPFAGVLRGLIHPSVTVDEGMKIGDLDPRNDPSFVHRVSDKALAVGGGVLEALLTKANIREQLWG